jgi:hypothetical protein
MGESEWQHASWVSSLGKWAWVIGVLNGIIGILYYVGLSFIYWWYPFYLVSQIWNIILAIIGIAISFLVIKPKFSKPCGEKDWDALYGWVLNLGGFNIPWMLIWGIILLYFGWWSWAAYAVLIPAIVLLFAGPKEYNWSSEEK